MASVCAPSRQVRTSNPTVAETAIRDKATIARRARLEPGAGGGMLTSNPYLEGR
jgi:hypothetical protein